MVEWPSLVPHQDILQTYGFELLQRSMAQLWVVWIMHSLFSSRRFIACFAIDRQLLVYVLWVTMLLVRSAQEVDGRCGIGVFDHLLLSSPMPGLPSSQQLGDQQLQLAASYRVLRWISDVLLLQLLKFLNTLPALWLSSLYFSGWIENHWFRQFGEMTAHPPCSRPTWFLMQRVMNLWYWTWRFSILELQVEELAGSITAQLPQSCCCHRLHSPSSNAASLDFWFLDYQIAHKLLRSRSHCVKWRCSPFAGWPFPSLRFAQQPLDSAPHLIIDWLSESRAWIVCRGLLAIRWHSLSFGLELLLWLLRCLRALLYF